MAELKLTEKQQATVAFAITLVCAVVIVCFVGVVFLLLGLFISKFSNILLPLAVAGILAMMLKPFHRFLTRMMKGRKWLAVVVVFLSILIPLGLMIAVFGVTLVNQSMELYQDIKDPELSEKIDRYVEETMPAIREFWEKHELEEKLKAALDEHGALFVSWGRKFGEGALNAWGSVFQAAAGLLGWFVLPIYLAYFLVGEPIGKGKLEDFMPFLKEGTRKDLSYLVFEFVGIVVSFFRGQLVIALIQGVLFAVGFSLVGLGYGFTIGLILGLLNVVPYLGSMVGLSVALPMALFQTGGGPVMLGLVLVVFTVVQCIEGYVLTPRIMGEQTGLHPLMIMIAIFFWGSVFGGITGMLLAIPLTAFLVVFWRLARTKYITEVL
jgi:predicted PurR-regulated permease PerM